MNLALLIALSIPAGCFLAPATASQRTGNTDSTQTIQARRDPFPTPREGLKLPAATAEAAMTLAELTTEFSRVSGETILIDNKVRQVLQGTTVGLNRALEVPPAEVYFVVETLLVENGLLFSRLSDREPRLLALHSVQNSGPLRAGALTVPLADLDVWTRHPAFLVTTSIDLPNTDVRTLSNSMRSMLHDANTQQIIPVGNSNTLILTGFGPGVSSLVDMLRATDAAMARELERRPKPEAEKPAPKTETPPAKSKD